MTDMKVNVVPLEAFTWYPKHRILVTDWGRMQAAGVSSMAQGFVVIGQRHRIMFEYKEYNRVHGFTVAHCDGDNVGYTPEEFKDIQIWYFSNPSLVMSPDDVKGTYD